MSLFGWARPVLRIARALERIATVLEREFPGKTVVTTKVHQIQPSDITRVTDDQRRRRQVEAAAEKTMGAAPRKASL